MCHIGLEEKKDIAVGFWKHAKLSVLYMEQRTIVSLRISIDEIVFSVNGMVGDVETHCLRHYQLSAECFLTCI